ncbi:MAG: hypothetical protein EXS55_00650 [Candidatus Magasanikbacteria bacterium]|nr:hypothetical protein [Candidatus Magasanikbacteria bacterium]
MVRFHPGPLMNKDKKIVVAKTHTGERLDLFLTKKLRLSRSQVQKLIAQEQITLKGALPKKMGSVVRTGDSIVVISSGAERSREISPSIRDSSTRRLGSSVGMTTPTTRAVAETPDYVVINKPTGLLVHPTQAKETNTLVAWLIKKYPKIKKVGDHPLLTKEGRGVVTEAKTFRPGIVHRLDKEASGLMVVAKTQPMFDLLKDQFKNRTIEKEYWVLVHGSVSKDWDILTFPIARSETHERMAARPLTASQTTANPSVSLLGKGRIAQPPPFQGGVGVVAEDAGAKDAKTEFFVEKRFVNFTLLRVIIHTGRMHQIRVHMLAYNHPLVGDPLYKQIKRKSKWDEKLGRMFLHSTKLSFTDLTGERQTFESPLPEELEKFLKTLS